MKFKNILTGVFSKILGGKQVVDRKAAAVEQEKQLIQEKMAMLDSSNLHERHQSQ